MKPWTLIDRAKLPGDGGELCLCERAGELSIRVGHRGLMSSRMHGSEEALAELACARRRERAEPSVLIGGLGMGYTLAAALRRLGPRSSVLVAELVPAVTAWNRGPLAHLAGHPLRDERVCVRDGDVATLLRAERGAYDAILLDVDNGPEALTRRDNAWLYGSAGLECAHAALRPCGVLAVWSAFPDPAFVRRLRRAGFEVAEHRVYARSVRRGARHRVWIAARGT